MNNANVAELVLSAAVVVACAFPATRIALKRPVRRELRAHPLLGAAVIIASLVTAAGAGWLAQASPVARRTFVALVALTGLIAWIHARPSYGRRRGLPGGSMGLAASLDAIDDPSFYAREAARHGPVFKMRQVHQPVACITDLEVSRGLLERDDGSLGQSEWSFNRLVPGGYLEYMEGGAHARYRRVFAEAFTSDVVDATRKPIAATSRAQCSAMSTAAGTSGVHPEPFLYEVPFVGLLHGMLGVTPDDSHMPALRAGFASITVPFEVHLPTPPAIARGYADLVAITRQLAATASGSPVPSVLRSLVRQNGANATDETVLGNLVLMVKEGAIMVRGLLRWVLKALAGDASQQRAFRDASADPSALDALSSAFVRETLRLHESRYLYRTTRSETTVGGFRIPRGWLLRLCIGEAHENPVHFPNPQRFDPSRFSSAMPDAATYCPFGTGTHACLGDDLTLAIAGGFAREAALGWDIKAVSDGPMWRINRHWGLWRPSPEFRVTLIPRAR